MTTNDGRWWSSCGLQSNANQFRFKKLPLVWPLVLHCVDDDIRPNRTQHVALVQHRRHPAHQMTHWSSYFADNCSCNHKYWHSIQILRFRRSIAAANCSRACSCRCACYCCCWMQRLRRRRRYCCDWMWPRWRAALSHYARIHIWMELTIAMRCCHCWSIGFHLYRCWPRSMANANCQMYEVHRLRWNAFANCSLATPMASMRTTNGSANAAISINYDRDGIVVMSDAHDLANLSVWDSFWDLNFQAKQREGEEGRNRIWIKTVDLLANPKRPMDKIMQKNQMCCFRIHRVPSLSSFLFMPMSTPPLLPLPLPFFFGFRFLVCMPSFRIASGRLTPCSLK